MRIRTSLLALAVAFAAAAAPAAAQTGARLAGRVVDAAGSPVAGAEITIEGTRLVAETGADGRFVFAAVSPGRYRIRVQRLGFVTARVDANVDRTGVAPLEITLDSRAVELDGLTIIGSETELAEIRERLRSIPGSVVLIEPAELRGTRQANFQDLLRFTPGVFAQPRFGAADESQLSIRGSGLRNNFHLRGVNVLVNGMPYRNADGFTDFESIELLTTENVQVYKAANAFRFGGATLGGAINLETKTGYTASPLTVYAQGGAYGFLKAQASSGAVFDGFDYYASYARTQVDGFRSYSGQMRDRVNAHVGWVISPALDARAFYLFANVEEDLPGSLTLEEYESDRRGAAPNNVTNQWGRDYELHHFGVQLRAQLAPEHRLDIAPYTQYRDIVHPIFRVIDQISRDFGVEARYETSAALAGREHSFSAGVQIAYGNIDNRNFDNEGGESGALRKDQRDAAELFALYAEDRLSIGDRVALVGGLRWSRATRTVDDGFLSDGDQSDDREFTAWLPRVGLLIDAGGADAQVYANASRAYEPPLILELNSLTVPGFIDLAAQDAWQFEVGTRGASGRFAWDFAIYDMAIRDEIMNVNVEPFPNAGFTVPTYRNAAKTRHSGLEAGLTARIGSDLFTSATGGDELTLRAAYTYSRFVFVDDDEHADNRLPGAPEHSLQLAADYRHPRGITVRPNLEWVGGDYFADSANQVANDGWLAFGARVEWTVARLGAMLFVEGRNLGDEVYSPAVTVDDSNGRHYLPADGRSLYVGFRWER